MYTCSPSPLRLCGSNYFELALAVAIGTFGLQFDEALMSVIGALIEIPTMLALVKLGLYFRAKQFAVRLLMFRPHTDP
jgi:ACR3 family arsenite efflux pump ArsB